MKLEMNNLQLMKINRMLSENENKKIADDGVGEGPGDMIHTTTVKFRIDVEMTTSDDKNMKSLIGESLPNSDIDKKGISRKSQSTGKINKL